VGRLQRRNQLVRSNRNIGICYHFWFDYDYNCIGTIVNEKRTLSQSIAHLRELIKSLRARIKEFLMTIDWGFVWLLITAVVCFGIIAAT